MNYISIHKLLKNVWTVTLIVFAFSMPVMAQSKDDALKFDPFPKGPAEDIVKKVWMQIPAYQDYISMYNTVPDHMIATADLNGDGKAEIFARHSDPEGSFCQVGTHACQLFIYTIADNKVVPISNAIMSSGPVIVLSEKTGGYNNLLISDVKQKLQTFVWNGKIYAQK